MKKITLLILTAAATIATATAQTTTSISANTDNGRSVTVTALTDNIIKVSNIPQGQTIPESRTTLSDLTPSGEVVTYNLPGASMLATATGVRAIIDDATGAVTITAGRGKSLVDNGLRPTADGTCTLTLTTSGNESFYGAGERGHAFNLAGDTLLMYNKAAYGYTKQDSRSNRLNITMPLVISSAGYALLFDDYAASELILNNPIEYISESDEPISYFFINSDGTMASTVSELSRLTGRQPIAPLWALGYITSRYGYRSQDETLSVADSLKTAGYPLDGIVIDHYWFGQGEDMGALVWDNEVFPDPDGMMSALKKRDINTIIITEPFVLKDQKGADNFRYLDENRMLARDSAGNTGGVSIWVGDGGLIDVSNPQTRQWYADIYRANTNRGVTGWWGDLGEPEMHPDSLVHFNGKGARQYHNLYGNEWASIISELFSSDYPDTRLMTLMRGGTVGLQRYNVFPWSGDVSRSWGGLQAQIPIMLGSGLSGLGYMSHDVGGFAVDPSNPVDPELYVRWLQVGLFTPTLRTHSTVHAEPYYYPEYQDILLPLIKERYRLLPYNYTLAYENAAKGLPLVRPLNFYDNAASNLDDIEDQYLWGRDMMVAPVIEPGVQSRRIVFPTGTWIDPTDTSRLYHAGDTIVYPTPLNVIPVFVRAGAFIPTADYAMDNTTDYRTDRYTIDYYPVEGLSDGTIYEDNLTHPGVIANGDYNLINFAGDASAEAIKIEIASTPGSDRYVTAKPLKEITLRVHGLNRKPATVTVDGRKYRSNYDKATGVLTIALKWNSANHADIEITR